MRERKGVESCMDFMPYFFAIYFERTVNLFSLFPKYNLVLNYEKGECKYEKHKKRKLSTMP